MTSTPSQSSTPAQSTPAATTAPSYASAAGSKKAPTTTGPTASHNAKSASISNGRPVVTPALPVQGVSSVTGEASRKSSVTNGSTYPGNVNANHSHKNSIKFGNIDSPVMSHNTPQVSAAPQQLPSNSPAPPSPIPISAVSGGGRPPSVALGGMTFGSLGSDDRSRQPQHVPPPSGSHGRRESSQSAAGSDMGSQNHNRNSYHGRGRSFNNNGGGSFNSHHNSPMGFPPSSYRGNAGPGGRGGMPFQPGSHSHGGHNQNRGPMHVTSSPQPSRSPHLANSAMSTPNMPPASLAQPMAAQQPSHQYYHQPMGGMQPYGYPSNPGGQYSMSQNMGMTGVPGYQYNMPPYGGPPNSAPYGQNFNAPPFTPGAPAAPMVRSGSQQADKPAPSAPQSFAPIVGSGAPPAPGGKSAFVRPAKSAAIRITTPQGEAVDLSTVKAPVSPAPASSNKASAASANARAGANAHPTKTTKEVQEELRLKIAQFTSRGAAEAPAKDEGKETFEKEATEKATADAKAKAEAETEAEAEAKVKAEAEAKVKAEAETKVKAEEEEAKAKAKANAAAAPAAAPADDEDEMERMIREMEEMERLEAEREAEYSRKKAAEEAKKAAAESANKKKNDAEADRKLREQEREMERLEEEKERRRAKGGPTKTVAELMAMSRSGMELPSEEKPAADAASDKAKASQEPKIPKIEAPAGAGRGDNKARKPAALNLAPLASKTIEPAQPSAALQSLKSARFLTVMNSELYPSGILSPNPALNSAVSKKGKTFQYDAAFLLQFKTVFTEQPSVEFQSQVKTLIGDENNRGGSARSSTPRTGSSKGGAANPIGAPIGGFGSGRMGSGPGGMVPRSGTNPIGQFSRGSSFPSSRNASSNIPGSPRVGSSRAGRNNSNRPPKADKQAAQMPLTAGQEIKPIVVSESGWKPASLVQKPGSGPTNGPMDPAMVQRKVKAALNKMTPENFERISEQIMAIASQSKDETDGRTLRQVIQLTFEKATDEAHWASMYAKFCKRMLDNTSNEIKDDSIRDKNGAVVTGGTLFRKYLLTRCQKEFERGWKVNLPKTKEGEQVAGDSAAGEAVLMSDEYYAAAAAKRRGLGLVQFIGELYKLGMLTDRIMHGCIRGLVDFNGEPDESEIESLSKLLTTIGGALETSANSPLGRNTVLMDAYFERIKSVIEMPTLNSRLKFMLMDVVDLRKKGWKGKEVNKGPKTLDEVRAEAEAAAAAKAAEAAKVTRGGPGRPPIGHGDARSYSNGHGGHSNSNQIGKDDLKRLRGMGRPGGHNVTLGPGGSLGSRSNSGRHRMSLIPMMSRGNEDSASSSRTGTPAPSNMNSYDILASLDNHPGSPPSAAASPVLAKATPDTGDK
ncbi:hypothetical protein TD95_000406, partial [Thielaviopsis punctulata]